MRQLFFYRLFLLDIVDIDLLYDLTRRIPLVRSIAGGAGGAQGLTSFRLLRLMYLREQPLPPIHESLPTLGTGLNNMATDSLPHFESLYL